MRFVFALFLGASAACAQSPAVSGKWLVRNDISGNRSEQTCTFAVNNQTLHGQCTSENTVVDVTGTLSNEEVTWQYETRRHLIKLTVTHKGKVKGDSIGGTVQVNPFNVNGSFTATLIK